MKIDDSRGGGELKIEELTYDKARKVKASLLKLRKILTYEISIRRGDIVSHGKGYAISYLCYSFYPLLVGCPII